MNSEIESLKYIKINKGRSDRRMNKIIIILIILLFTITMVNAYDSNNERIYIYNNFGEMSWVSIEEYNLLTNVFVSESYKFDILYRNRVCIEAFMIKSLG